jgi:energy-converting hydrogenase Eha subunit B
MNRPLQWLERRDSGLVALRRAGRVAIVMPAMFALGEEVIGNATVATFAAFGSIAMLLFADFGGPLRERLQAEASLAVVGAAFVCLATLASRSVWLAAAAMALVGFAVIFAGVVSSVLAGAATSLLLPFILPVTLAAPVSAVPDRLAGWGIAAGASLIAVALLWPAPAHDRLRIAAASACSALATRLRAEVAFAMSDGGESFARARQHAFARSDHAVAALRRAFLATPYRPTSLGTVARVTVRLVDELGWLDTIVVESAQTIGRTPDPTVRGVEIACAAVLERGAELLGAAGGDCAELHAALAELTDALRSMEAHALVGLPLGRERAEAPSDAAEEADGELVSSLDPGFRAQELGFAVSRVGHNADLIAAAERRSWLERALGRQPEGLVGTLSAAQERASAHVDRNSVWLHNSVRGAVGLALAVFVGNRTGAQHSFWVVLGTLSVLRSNALSTGQNVLRALSGTVVGFIVGAAILAAIGTDETLLWLLLAPVILLAGVAPAAISFAAGQAAFTLTLVFVFNIIEPTGWRVGLYRVEDIALGCAVSLVVGLLFWPRGARSALRRALADAYRDSADYLAASVSFGIRRCDSSAASAPAPTELAARATGAARRLDDAFRAFLAERGAKPIALADVTSLITGVGGLRLAADAVLDLWQREGGSSDGSSDGERSAARNELLRSSELVKDWYEGFARSLAGGGEPQAPLPHDPDADERLLAAVRHDLRSESTGTSATAVRMIWTGEHLDAVRRQEVVLAPARPGDLG